MAGLGDRIAGLIGNEQIGKIKSIGTEAIGDLIGTLASGAQSEAETSSAPPPTGKKVEPAAPPASAIVDSANPPAIVDSLKHSTRERNVDSVADKIIELGRLREKGLLSDSEFSELKSALLSN